MIKRKSSKWRTRNGTCNGSII